MNCDCDCDCKGLCSNPRGGAADSSQFFFLGSIMCRLCIYSFAVFLSPTRATLADGDAGRWHVRSAVVHTALGHCGCGCHLQCHSLGHWVQRRGMRSHLISLRIG